MALIHHQNTAPLVLRFVHLVLGNISSWVHKDTKLMMWWQQRLRLARHTDVKVLRDRVDQLWCRGDRAIGVGLGARRIYACSTCIACIRDTWINDRGWYKVIRIIWDRFEKFEWLEFVVWNKWWLNSKFGLDCKLEVKRDEFWVRIHTQYILQIKEERNYGKMSGSTSYEFFGGRRNMRFVICKPSEKSD